MTRAPHRATELLGQGNGVLPYSLSVVDEAPVTVSLQGLRRQLPSLRAQARERQKTALRSKENKSGLQIAAFGVAKNRQLRIQWNVGRAPSVSQHNYQGCDCSDCAHAFGPVFAQPRKKPFHTNSPVLSDNFTVRATAGGVTPHAITGSMRSEGC